MKLLIQNGHLIDPANRVDAPRDLLIADGKILAVCEPGHRPGDFTPERTLDARGLIVMPGVVDLAARLREPGSEHKSMLTSELNAAVAGGVTSLVCPPDTDPVLDEPGLVEMLKKRAARLALTNVYPLGALTVGLKGQVLTEMAGLVQSGCIGFSQADQAIDNTNVLLLALRYAATFGYAVWLRPQDAFLGRGGIAHGGAVAARLGLSGVPVAAETVALHTIFELMRVTGARVHLCRLSSAAGLELVRTAKRDGLPVTCDVGIHHVHLSENDIGYFDPSARMTPPLRSTHDCDAIGAALIDGTIDAICSDHTPVSDDDKLLPFGEAEPGATGLELLLSLVLKWAQERDVPLVDALSSVTDAAARAAGIKTGQLRAGDAADLCLFDTQARWAVRTNSLRSQSRHTPFTGIELPGQVGVTLIGGRIVFERNAA